MSEYVKRIAMAAIRATGQPCAISPQLEDYNRIPNVRRPMEGDATEYRLILYVGYIDTSDITITFPKEHEMRVVVKHGMKAVDAMSHRLSKMPGNKVPRVILENHCPLMCSREDSSDYLLPSTVKKSSLTAHMTQDGFLVIQCRMTTADAEKRTGFDIKRLVVMKVCRDLQPSLNSVTCRVKAISAMDQAAALVTDVRESVPPEVSDIKYIDENVAGWEEASESEKTGKDLTRRKEVESAVEVSRSEERQGRIVRSELSPFTPINSGEIISKDRSREVVEDSRKSGQERRDSHVTGDGMRFRAIDMMVRKDGSPKGKDTKEKSCVSKPTPSASGGQSSVADKPELHSKETNDVDESSDAKSSNIAEESSSKMEPSKEKSTERKTASEKEPNTERISETKDSSVEGKASDSKDADVEEQATDSKDADVEEQATDSKDADVEEQATDSKDADVEEQASDSKRPGTKKKGTASAKASSEEKPSPEKSAECGEVSSKKKPSAKKDTKKNPSPVKDEGGKEQSSLVKDSTQSTRITRRKDSKTEPDASDEVSQPDPQDGKEENLLSRRLRSKAGGELAAPPQLPASPLKLKSKKGKEAPGTPKRKTIQRAGKPEM